MELIKNQKEVINASNEYNKALSKLIDKKKNKPKEYDGASLYEWGCPSYRG